MRADTIVLPYFRAAIFTEKLWKLFQDPLPLLFFPDDPDDFFEGGAFLVESVT